LLLAFGALVMAVLVNRVRRQSFQSSALRLGYGLRTVFSQKPQLLNRLNGESKVS
jgi:hypothetical protein